MTPIRFIQALDDRLSPIIIKELRQAARSRYLRIGFALLALLDLVGLAAFLRYSGRSAADVWAFRLTHAVMLGLCLTLIPSYTAMRLWAERGEGADDLILLSGLRPHRLIFCKLLTAAILFLGICLVSAPVLTFVHFLGGINVTTILDVLLLDFTVTLACTQVLILLITVHHKGPINVCFVGTGLLMLLPCAYLLAHPGYSPGSLSYYGEALRNREADSLLWLTPVFAWSGILLGLRSPQRTSPVRLAALLAWLALTSATYFVAGPEGLSYRGWDHGWSYYHELVHGDIGVWGWVNVGCFCLALLVVAGQRHSSRRHASTPSAANSSGPQVSSLFTGWTRCSIYTLFGVGLSALVAFWHLSGWLYPTWYNDLPGGFLGSRRHSAWAVDEFTGWPGAIGFGLWAVCYGVSAGVAGRIFLGTTVTSKLTRVRASLLIVLVAVMPLAVRPLLEARFPGFAHEWSSGSLHASKDAAIVLIADKPWGFALIAAASPWFFASKRSDELGGQETSQ